MNGRLHWLLLALTLVDLGFVQTTGIVPDSNMLYMWLLAGLSPLLRRLQRFAPYRAAWNAIVLLLFALLVQRASSTGLIHLLEDGLLLAALCQVHLLNNTGVRQQPDLAFFNSFLIAFVTSFFSGDETWSMLFALHALIFVPALQTYVCTRRNSGGKLLNRASLTNSIGHAVTIGLVTLIVFVVWPRDFQRRGWLHEAMTQRMGISNSLTERIQLDNERPATLSDEIVMRITSAHPSTTVPTHWRSLAFTTFTNGTWLPHGILGGARARTDLMWHGNIDGIYRRDMKPLSGGMHISLASQTYRRLPLPLTACEIQLHYAPDAIVDPRPYGVVAITSPETSPHRPLEYFVRTSKATPPRVISERMIAHLVEIPDAIRRVVTELAEPLGSMAGGADARPAAIATTYAEWLKQSRRYRLPGRHGFAGSFGEFLIGAGGGHCEYFASALALMLRAQGVPSRVIAGYHAHELDHDGTTIVRQRHAHAWVEALMPDGTWMTVDPTPASNDTQTEDGNANWWRFSVAWLGTCWSRLVGFDELHRSQLAANIIAAPGALLRSIVAQPWITALLLALSVFWFYYRHQQRQQPAVTVALFAATRAAGLELRTGETPRELLTRAHSLSIEKDRIEALQMAVRQHEYFRYRGAKHPQP